jgi:excisionase family DNA binding protein
MAERTLLIDEAAAVLGVSRRTVYYRIREGRLRTIRTKCGSQRVLVSSIEVLLREAAAKTTRKRGRRPGARRASDLEAEALPL